MTMRNLGLSIYPDHSEYQKDAEYLELGHKYGFTRIFMSMLEVQVSVEETKAKYKKNHWLWQQLGLPNLYRCFSWALQEARHLLLGSEVFQRNRSDWLKTRSSV